MNPKISLYLSFSFNHLFVSFVLSLIRSGLGNIIIGWRRVCRASKKYSRYSVQPVTYCVSKCNYRCSKASRHKMCIRACNTCCHRCNCVPPGTSGNKDVCPCYAKMKTHGGRPKCP
ncbi:hypothetical protein ACHQM5_017500 [Ranunculus cassubicifolius]